MVATCLKLKTRVRPSCSQSRNRLVASRCRHNPCSNHNLHNAWFWRTMSQLLSVRIDVPDCICAFFLPFRTDRIAEPGYLYDFVLAHQHQIQRDAPWFGSKSDNSQVHRNQHNCLASAQPESALITGLGNDQWRGQHSELDWRIFKGTTTLTAGSAVRGSLSNLHVGSLVILDQLDDSSDTGNAYFCGNSSCSQQGDGGNVFAAGHRPR